MFVYFGLAISRMTVRTNWVYITCSECYTLNPSWEELSDLRYNFDNWKLMCSSFEHGFSGSGLLFVLLVCSFEILKVQII